MSRFPDDHLLRASLRESLAETSDLPPEELDRLVDELISLVREHGARIRASRGGE